jgi:hypothetical protein
MSGSSDGPTRNSARNSVYGFLERLRAGVGAAGATAVLLEGIASTRLLGGIIGSGVTIFIGILAAIAFVVAIYVIEVPTREQDFEK